MIASRNMPPVKNGTQSFIEAQQSIMLRCLEFLHGAVQERHSGCFGRPPPPPAGGGGGGSSHVHELSALPDNLAHDCSRF